MFRKLLLSGIVSAATITGLTALPTAADARERHIRLEHRHMPRFEVRVRTAGCWDVRSSYQGRVEALREAARLRHLGLIVEVQACD